MNLTANHCKLLQKVWKDLRDDKLSQIERPVLWSISYSQPEKSLVCSPSSSLGVICLWNDPAQQDLYTIVLSFVDNAIAELKSRQFRQRLGEHCRRLGRHLAMVFRGTNSDVDQSLSWEMLGQAIVENLAVSSHLRGSAATARLFVWQLFLENLSALVFEAFVWSVARDYTSTPLATIYEEDNDPKTCFPYLLDLKRKLPLYKRLIAKFSRKALVDGKDKHCTRSTSLAAPPRPLHPTNCSLEGNKGNSPLGGCIVRSSTFCAEEF